MFEFQRKNANNVKLKITMQCVARWPLCPHLKQISFWPSVSKSNGPSLAESDEESLLAAALLWSSSSFSLSLSLPFALRRTLSTVIFFFCDSQDESKSPRHGSYPNRSQCSVFDYEWFICEHIFKHGTHDRFQIVSSSRSSTDTTEWIEEKCLANDILNS